MNKQNRFQRNIIVKLLAELIFQRNIIVKRMIFISVRGIKIFEENAISFAVLEEEKWNLTGFDGQKSFHIRQRGT